MLATVLAFFAGPLGRWVIIGLLMLSAAVGGAAMMHKHDAVKYDELNREYGQYVGKTESAGAAYEAARKLREAKEQREKEKADEARNRDRSALAAALRKLREQAADARGGSAGQNPPNSSCPDGLTCFDRAEYQRAVGVFDQGARRLADQCSALIADLNVGKNWAQGKYGGDQ